jgi:hypothetical protein
MLEIHQLENIENYLNKNQVNISIEPKKYKKILLSRRITEGFMVILFTYVGLLLGPLDVIHTPIWPHTGVLLGMLFLRGSRIVPSIFIGCCIAFAQYRMDLSFSLSMALLHTAATYFIYVTALTLIGSVVPLCRLKVLIKTVFLMAILGSTFGWLYYQSICWFEGIKATSIGQIQAILSYSLGLIIFTPICLIWDTYIPGMKPKLSKIGLILAITVVLLANIAYSVSTIPWVILAAFTLSLILCWLAALSYGQFGASFTCMISGLFLLTFIDLPGITILQTYPDAVVWMQASLFLNTMLTLGVSTHRKEKTFQRFVADFYKKT